MIWGMSIYKKIVLEGSFSIVSRPILQDLVFAAFVEIYKMSALVERSNLKIVTKCASF